MRPVVPRAEVSRRLKRIFPEGAHDASLSSAMGSATAAALLYVDALIPDTGEAPESTRWITPVMACWLNDEALGESDPARRTAWYSAALDGIEEIERVERTWGLTVTRRWYATGSRENVRKGVLKKWLDFGAVRQRPGLTTNSSTPRWAMTESFADLFNPALTGDALGVAIDAWLATHTDVGTRLRTSTYRQREQGLHAVDVTLPSGVVRRLAPGDASLILKGVIEQWAPARMGDPVVLAISEPGDQVYVVDERELARLNITIDRANVLPDALLADIRPAQPVEFWVIEAVASDGPVDEDRKAALLEWAAEQRIPVTSVRFLSAFLDRNHAPAKRRLKDLAVGTFAWYLTAPAQELAWYELGEEA